MSIMVAVLIYAMAIFVNVHLVGKWVTTNLIAVQWKQKWWHNAIRIKWKFLWTDVFCRIMMSTAQRQVFLIDLWLAQQIFLGSDWPIGLEKPFKMSSGNCQFMPTENDQVVKMTSGLEECGMTLSYEGSLIVYTVSWLMTSYKDFYHSHYVIMT